MKGYISRLNTMYYQWLLIHKDYYNKQKQKGETNVK